MSKCVAQCPCVLVKFQILQPDDFGHEQSCAESEGWILNLKSDQERQEQEQDHETCTNLKKAPPYGRGLIK